MLISFKLPNNDNIKHTRTAHMGRFYNDYTIGSENKLGSTVDSGDLSSYILYCFLLSSEEGQYTLLSPYERD